MNNSFDDAVDLVTSAAESFWDSTAEFLPRLIGAFLLLVLGALLAKLAERGVYKLLDMIGIDKLRNRDSVKKTLAETNLDVDFKAVISRTTFWLVILVFTITAADALELNAMRDIIRELLNYVPNVLAAVFVLTVTLAGARLLKGAVKVGLKQVDIQQNELVSSVAQWTVVIFGGVFALDQLGFDTTILTTNITLIVGAVFAALALAIGLGGRDLAADLMAYQAINQVVAVGDTFELSDGTKGTVEKITHTSMVVKTKTGNRVVPNRAVL